MSTARFGLARSCEDLLGSYNPIVAAQAAELAPSDPDSHRARGVLLTLSSNAGTTSELERRLCLRPFDYTQWADLGLVRDQMGDPTGALIAFDEAVRLAPFYALPRWQRGNLLFRLGRYDAAFTDLNQAAQSNPEFIPSLIDLAWSLSHGDPKVVQQLVQVNTKTAHIALAKYFASHGQPQAAMTELSYSGDADEETRHQLIESMLAKGSFAEAFQVWSAGHGLTTESSQARPQILDGGFEGTLNFDETGFGWNSTKVTSGNVSQDSSQPHSGSKNLRIDFAGDSFPGTVLVSQLILVEPSLHYKINFAVRSQDVVTGGLPVVTITDASGRS